LKELVEEFYNINYFSLNDTFDKIVKTDQPTVITSININGTFKSIFDNLGAIAPEDLRVLENRIDEITNSSKWIEPYVHPQGKPIR
jgi:capsid portal protein